MSPDSSPNSNPNQDRNRGNRYRGNRSGGRPEANGNTTGPSNGNRGPRNDRQEFPRRDSGNRPGGHPDGNRSFRNDRPNDRNFNRKPESRDGQGPREHREGRGWVEVTGRSVEDAREEAARRFNVGPDQMRIEVIHEGSKGFLGLGSKPAKLKVSLKPAAAPAYAEVVLTRVLRAMGLPDKVQRKKDADGNTVLDVVGPSGGLLIGRHGQNLESLQYIVSKIVQKACDDERSLVVIDIESYRERQREKLQEMANGMAKRAAETGQTVALQPMSSRDRRVVHLTLRDHAEVTTQSTGEGLRRRVMIVPKHPKVAENTAPLEAAPMEPGTVSEPEGQESGNDAPAYVPEAVVSTPAAAPEDHEMIGNAVAPEPPEMDDNIGNRA